MALNKYIIIGGYLNICQFGGFFKSKKPIKDYNKISTISSYISYSSIDHILAYILGNLYNFDSSLSGHHSHTFNFCVNFFKPQENIEIFEIWVHIH